MKPFVPNTLPLKNIDWERIVPKISKANRELARYDGILVNISNPEELLAPLISSEAVLSSQIEGTRATFDDLLRYEANPNAKEFENSDVKVVLNYKTALEYAVKRMDEDGIPISLKLVKEMHRELMEGVRGEEKDPGKFRIKQNWIGPPNSVQETATYVPPEPKVMQNALKNFEEYVQAEDKDILVQLAIIHAQFEIIHPFRDGNGRLGRLLIPLILYDKKVLSRPIFYVSSYFEYQRHLYYSKLNNISQKGDWDSWIEYFLDTVIHQSIGKQKVVKEIIALRKEMEERVEELTQSPHIIKTLNFIFSKPIFTFSEFVAKSKIPKSAANRILQSLRGKILEYDEGKGSKASIYRFESLLKITNPAK